METWEQENFLTMLKALADDSRLTLMRLLAEREHSVGDLAGRLELSEPTVSHHLTRLREANFVSLRMAGNQRFYRLNTAGLDEFKRLAEDIERLPTQPERKESDNRWIDALGWSAEDSKVLRDFSKDGKLTRLPIGRHKTLMVIMRWVATLFEPERRYSEPEVNVILKSVYAEDFVSLRRDMIDFGYLRRELGGGKYWLTPPDEGNVIRD
jgi:predicted transcriptional regulator